MISNESDLDRIIADICRDDSDLQLDHKRRGNVTSSTTTSSTESTQKGLHKRYGFKNNLKLDNGDYTLYIDVFQSCLEAVRLLWEHRTLQHKGALYNLSTLYHIHYFTFHHVYIQGM